MNNAQLRSIAESQTGIAKKVLCVVPLADWWNARQIISEMHRLYGSRQDVHIVQGCLDTLRESGLIRESPSGTFQRIPYKQETPQMQKPQAAAPVPTPVASPFDRLIAGAEKLRSFGTAATSLAAEIDAAALAFEEAASAPNEELAKLRQLQSLLKSLS